MGNISKRDHTWERVSFGLPFGRLVPTVRSGSAYEPGAHFSHGQLLVYYKAIVDALRQPWTKAANQINTLAILTHASPDCRWRRKDRSLFY